MKVPIYILDTFTSTPFKGNPTAVCKLSSELSYETMHAIANELSVPVTAFMKLKEGSNAYDIRYFTSTTEIPACGHATLACSKIAFQWTAERITEFHTINNVTIKTSLKDHIVVMSYPKFSLESCPVSEQTLSSLNLTGYKDAGYTKELETLFIEIDNADILRKIQPDYELMVKSASAIKEIVITCASDNAHYDYLLRSFCPWIGIDEDPVTGSVHSVLAGFWQARLGKDVMTAYQASPRGGELLVEAFDDKVDIGGHSVILIQGEINLP